MRLLRWLRWTLVGVAVLALLGLRSLPGGPCIAACRTSTASSTARRASRPKPRIERDARGVPVITAASRADLAFATGYAHAQDRFFQMDLARRLAAGELSELFGAVALKQDTRARRFGFRAVARRVLEAAPARRTRASSRPTRAA